MAGMLTLGEVAQGSEDGTEAPAKAVPLCKHQPQTLPQSSVYVLYV